MGHTELSPPVTIRLPRPIRKSQQDLANMRRVYDTIAANYEDDESSTLPDSSESSPSSLILMSSNGKLISTIEYPHPSPNEQRTMNAPSSRRLSQNPAAQELIDITRKHMGDEFTQDLMKKMKVWKCHDCKWEFRGRCAHPSQPDRKQTCMFDMCHQ